MMNLSKILMKWIYTLSKWLLKNEIWNPKKAEFALLGCRYMTRGCISSWTNGFTRYGKCMQVQ